MRHALNITAALLGAVWLAAIAIGMAYLADLVGTEFLIGAMVAFVGVCALALALLLVTNTRRPRGIDPDAVSPPPPSLSIEDRSLMGQIGSLLEGAARRPRASVRVPDDLTHEQE